MTNLKTPTSKYERLFRRLTLLTVISVYLLFAAGSIVRSTGAGMGCPDWPKCFGSWVPPTEASQLPSNYKEIYGAKLKGKVEFNVIKTWTEYANRLLGAFTGLLIFGTVLTSIPYLRTTKSNLFYASLAAFILVGFQGWLGSKVVSTELHPLMVTLHMVVAIVIVFILIYILFKLHFTTQSASQRTESTPRIKQLTALAIMLSFGQVILGTQVREVMDEVILNLGYAARSQWIDQLGVSFYVHRSLSLLVLGVNALLIYRIIKGGDGSRLRIKLGIGILAAILLEILTGIIMAYFGVPAAAQPLHLTIAIIMLGAQYYLWLDTSQLTSESDQLQTNAVLHIKH